MGQSRKEGARGMSLFPGRGVRIPRPRVNPWSRAGGRPPLPSVVSVLLGTTALEVVS